MLLRIVGEIPRRRVLFN